MPIDYHSLHTGEVESMTYGLTDTIDRALKEHQAWYDRSSMFESWRVMPSIILSRALGTQYPEI
jgi:hypothetical protein